MESIENSLITNSLQDRIGLLCLSSQWSDCVFKIDTTYINAHRLILASASPVFEVMLYGPLAEVRDIVVYDIDQDTFKTMLKYIYTDKSSISSVDEACRLLYASNKYMLQTLKLLCKTFILKNLSISNALEILDFANVIDDSQLIEAGMLVVCAHTRYVFAETNYHANSTTMLEIAKQEKINISEMDLFNIILQWSDRECEEQGLESTKENMRAILIQSGILSQIRFLNINRNEVGNLVAINNVLTNDELDVIQKYFMNNTVNDKTVTPRKSINLTWRYCVSQYFKSAYPLWIDLNNSSTRVVIVSSKTVLINSFRVASRLTPPDIKRPFNAHNTTYSEKIIIQIIDSVGNLVIHSLFNTNANYNDNLNINLHRPVVLRCKESYTIKFKWHLDDCSGICAQYPQQFVSDIGNKNGVQFSITNQEATFLNGITYAI